MVLNGTMVSGFRKAGNPRQPLSRLKAITCEREKAIVEKTQLALSGVSATGPLDEGMLQGCHVGRAILAPDKPIDRGQ